MKPQQKSVVKRLYENTGLLDEKQPIAKSNGLFF